jgi:hypothetical protein
MILIMTMMKAYTDPYLDYDLDRNRDESLLNLYLDYDLILVTMMKAYINRYLDYDLDHDHDESLHKSIPGL